MPQTAESQTGTCERIYRIGNPYFPQPVPHGVVMGHSTHSGDLHLRKSFSQDANCVRSHPGLWGHSCMHFGWGPQERLALQAQSVRWQQPRAWRDLASQVSCIHN